MSEPRSYINQQLMQVNLIIISRSYEDSSITMRTQM